jgi:hypothetical protein
MDSRFSSSVDKISKSFLWQKAEIGIIQKFAPNLD